MGSVRVYALIAVTGLAGCGRFGFDGRGVGTTDDDAGPIDAAPLGWGAPDHRTEWGGDPGDRIAASW